MGGPDQQTAISESDAIYVYMALATKASHPESSEAIHSYH